MLTTFNKELYEQGLKEEGAREADQSEYSSAAKPPVRCGGSHLSGLTEPLVLHCHAWV